MTMRIELWLLGGLAASALGALLDSARRAARGDPDDPPPSPVPAPLRRSALEQLERTRAQPDDAGPRLLGALALVAALAAIVLEVGARCTDLAAMLAAVGLGLAVPAASWSRDLRVRAALLDTRIHDLRASLASPRRREAIRTSGAPPRRR